MSFCRSHRPVSAQAGQSITETILTLPLYLAVVFGLLQVGQLATGLLVVNYAASTIAREAVQENALSIKSQYVTRFTNLLTVGMTYKDLQFAQDTSTPPLISIKVDACAQLGVFPLLGEIFLKPALGTKYAGGVCGGPAPTLGPFSFNGSPPYRFTLHGTATARMNYQPQ